MTEAPVLPNDPLLTDLYQLTMLQAYHDQRMDEVAVFEFFVRRLPPERNFLVAAGLEQVLDYLEGVRFAADQIDWLASTGRFNDGFLDSLSTFRFEGDVDAMPEGTPFFADEPILRVTAPLPQAQFVETRIINLLHFETLVASKAARSVLVAPGKLLIDFGLRRAHGAEAGLLAARASYLAGFNGSSNVLAGQRWGVPIFGTMAHSFVQAHDDEIAAFEHFARSHPQNCTLLVDTYDTEAAVRRLVPLARRLRDEGIAVPAVRIDSGDLGEHARRVRVTLDAGGLATMRILASGNLDETAVRDLLAGGAPIDGFGIGTRMNTSADAPYLDCAYKLQEYGGRPRRKRSEGKETWPGRKQVYRRYDADGRLAGDVLTTLDDTPAGEALLLPAMSGGRRIGASPPLLAVRDFALRQLDRLPAALQSLDPAPPWEPAVSDALRTLAAAVDSRQQSQAEPR